MISTDIISNTTLIIGFLGLFIGTITDFKKREVPDWLNFFLIFSGLGLSIIGAIYYKDIFYIIIPLIWLLVAYLISAIMYYSGQWGGGDCKMIMGIATLFGITTFAISDPIRYLLENYITLPFTYNISFFANFIFNSFVIGAFYGVAWIIYYIISNYRKFIDTLKQKLKTYKKFIYFVLIFFLIATISIALLNLFNWHSFLLLLMILLFPFLIYSVKSVEESCMIRDMKIKDLTEGEWIAEDIEIDGKEICKSKELGLTPKQLNKLKKLEKKGKIEKVKVKVGIPFVPAFFLSFIFTIIYGNFVILFI
ncbi:MAG: A24 family peptidase [Nanobdellota archaeon]